MNDEQLKQIQDIFRDMQHWAGHNFYTHAEAENAAAAMNHHSASREFTVEVRDNGSSCSPRYSTQIKAEEGMPVSYAFNGDFYPAGLISKVSPTGKKITTTMGITFHRDSLGNYRHDQTWHLVLGTHTDKNPSF